MDALYAEFSSERSERYLEAISFSRGAGGKQDTVILPGAIVDGSNSLVSGIFNNVDVRVGSRFYRLTTKFQQYTGSLRQALGDRARVELLGGYSKSQSPIRCRPRSRSASLNVMENVTMPLEAINLTDQYVDSAADRPSAYHHTGRQFYLGLRFKL